MMHRLSGNLTVAFAFTLFLSVLAANKGFSQSIETDIALIRLASDIPVSDGYGVERHLHRKHAPDSGRHSRPPRFLGRNAMERYNPVSLVLSGSLYAYQNAISPQLSNRCIYHPSCSVFSREIITERGLVPGIILTADRISRCNRLSAMDAAEHRLDYEQGRIIDETARYHK
ncbi:MAG: membrane protein insertion efficiency factor YidD [Cyclonatronaceae bacterium]